MGSKIDVKALGDQLAVRCCATPGIKKRDTAKVVREALLISPMFYNGRLWSLVSKSVGAGIHEIWAERFTE